MLQSCGLFLDQTASMMQKPARRPISHFARSSILIGIFFGLDKIIGFVRALIVNRMFGLSYELDVFNAANNIPDLLSALISGGALGVALIPVLSEAIKTRGRPEAWEIFSRIINLAFIVTGALSILIILLAPWLVPNIIAPGFPAEQQALTIELMRLDLIAIMIFSISGLVMAGLQANQHFLLPALAPGLYNIGQIFGAVVLGDYLGLGIHGLVYGVILGALLHLGIQVPGLIRYQFRWTPELNLRHPMVLRVMRLLGPRVATMFFIQLFFIVRDNLASGMGEGAVTALNLGWFIMQVPETLLGTAIAIALLPTISELFAAGQHESFKNALNGAANAILALTIPVSALLAAGLPPLVQAAFGFDPQGTAMVVLATRVYLLGLTGHALLEISARSFYAQQDARTPLIAAALTSFSYIFLAVFFSRHIGFAGIALTNVIVFTVEGLALFVILNHRLNGFLKPLPTLGRVLTASTLSSGLVFAAFHLLQVDSLSTFGAATVALTSMAAGLLVVIPFILPELRVMVQIGATAAPEQSASQTTSK